MLLQRKKIVKQSSILPSKTKSTRIQRITKCQARCHDDFDYFVYTHGYYGNQVWHQGHNEVTI